MILDIGPQTVPRSRRSSPRLAPSSGTDQSAYSVRCLRRRDARARTRDRRFEGVFDRRWWRHAGCNREAWRRRPHWLHLDPAARFSNFSKARRFLPSRSSSSVRRAESRRRRSFSSETLDATLDQNSRHARSGQQLRRRADANARCRRRRRTAEFFAWDRGGPRGARTHGARFGAIVGPRGRDHGGPAGPKIRIGKFAAGKVVLKTGQQFTLDAARDLGDEEGVGLDYKELTHDVAPGVILLLNDGLIRARRVGPRHRDRHARRGRRRSVEQQRHQPHGRRPDGTRADGQGHGRHEDRGRDRRGIPGRLLSEEQGRHVHGAPAAAPPEEGHS